MWQRDLAHVKSLFFTFQSARLVINGVNIRGCSHYGGQNVDPDRPTLFELCIPLFLEHAWTRSLLPHAQAMGAMNSMNTNSHNSLCPLHCLLFCCFCIHVCQVTN